MTVSPAQIIAAQAKGLINVVPLAEACDKYKFPFHLGCVILDKETDGKNIFGHDKGGAFSDPDGKDIEVTEGRYREFRRLIDSGMTSNGVGPMQITWKGYFPVMESQGLKPWVPADNIMFGISILSASLTRGLEQGLTLEKAFWNTAKSYNGNASYADDAVVKARTWAATVGSSDMTVTERIPFRGGLTCSCVVESLPWVELDMIRRGVIKQSIDIKQLGYRDDVSASAGTHARGGCVDVAQRNAAAIDVWRRWGWTMQDRSPWFPDAPHAHGWPYGCPHLSDAAKAQRTDWNNRRNGLVNNEPVIGRWPVDKWDVALERMVPTLFTAEDIAKATVAEQIRRGAELGKAIAKGFLTADDIIASGRDEPDDTNKFQAAKTFVTNDHNLLLDIRELLKEAAKQTP